MRRKKCDAIQTRKAILDAAEDLFFEKGVASTTLSQIAAHASLTRGAIYWHFENKLALFTAMQERARLPQEEFFYDTSRTEPPSIEALYDKTIEALAFLASDIRTQRVMTILQFRCEYVGEMQPALQRRDGADRKMRSEIANIFAHALSHRTECADAADPQVIATSYYCCVSGVITEWLKSEKAFDLVEVGEVLLHRLVGDHLTPNATTMVTPRCRPR